MEPPGGEGGGLPTGLARPQSVCCPLRECARGFPPCLVFSFQNKIQQQSMDMFRWIYATVVHHKVVSILLMLLSLCPHTQAVTSNVSPDNTGLVGSSPDKPTLPFKLWARSPKSPLKPRKRDLHEPTLLHLLGPDMEPQWMRTRAGPAQDIEEGSRQTVVALQEMVVQQQLPEGLPSEYQDVLKEWLVQKATCPIRYVWDDLGPYFWPRWIRRGDCASTTQVVSHKNDSVPTAAEVKSCSWPPGMRCVPAVAKTLQVLRWHCRLRKSAAANSVWIPANVRKATERNRKKRRKRYRCQWLKVPYPVPEDCVCSC